MMIKGHSLRYWYYEVKYQAKVHKIPEILSGIIFIINLMGIYMLINLLGA